MAKDYSCETRRHQQPPAKLLSTSAHIDFRSSTWEEPLQDWTCYVVDEANGARQALGVLSLVCGTLYASKIID